jgi:hypothetical protein
LTIPGAFSTIDPDVAGEGDGCGEDSVAARMGCTDISNLPSLFFAAVSSVVGLVALLFAIEMSWRVLGEIARSLWNYYL